MGRSGSGSFRHLELSRAPVLAHQARRLGGLDARRRDPGELTA
jgi:hypothetical protein